MVKLNNDFFEKFKDNGQRYKSCHDDDDSSHLIGLNILTMCVCVLNLIDVDVNMDEHV